jgi:hypothetical protein
MSGFAHITMTRQWQIAPSVHLLMQRPNYKWLMTCVGMESSQLNRWVRIDHSLRTISVDHQRRFLASARPLPEEPHNEYEWSNKPMQVRTSKCDTVILKPRRTKSRLEIDAAIPKSSSSISAVDVADNTAVNVRRNVMIHHSPKEIQSDISAVSTALASFKVNTSILTTESPSSLRYTGDAVIPVTSILHIVKPQEDTPRGIWPVFRLMVSC